MFSPINQFMKELQGKFSSSLLSGLKGQQSPQNIAFLRQLQREMDSQDVLNTPLKDLSVVVLDIETTGFYPDKGDEILSIGAIKVSKGKIVENDTFYSLIQYDKGLSQEIRELTGLCEEDLKEAPNLPSVLTDFFTFVQECPIVAHHARHEIAFLQYVSWKIYRSQLKHRIIDTSFIARILEPSSTLVRLEDLCQYHGIPIIDRHHALGDAKLTAMLWTCYLERINQVGIISLKDLYERASRL